MREFRYPRIFMYASLQFCGHVEAYFAAHAEQVVFFIPFTRAGARPGLVREYRRGSLVAEYTVPTSGNILLYYLLWLWNHWRILLRHFRRGEPLIVFGGFPIVFFGMSLQRLLRPARFAYWIGDYFPQRTPVMRAFAAVQQFYHDRVAAAFYLTDRINRQFNRGTVSERPTRRTVMWGVQEAPLVRDPPGGEVRLLMVGLIKACQGLAPLLDFLAGAPDYTLEVVGLCPAELYDDFMRRIREHGLEARVRFPNRFLPEPELHELSRSCHIGMALYEVDPLSFTYYADPGKVKAYAEMGLPVVMTDMSEIAGVVRDCHSGEVISAEAGALGEALHRIRANYPAYVAGVRRFNARFAYEPYYAQAFACFEEEDLCAAKAR